MATYYLSSAGSNTAPYDTEAKAATSVWSIRGVEGFSVTDTIILCSDVSETTFDGGLYTKMCNMEAKPGLAVRPKITYNSNSGPYLSSVSGPISIRGIEVINDNVNAPIFMDSEFHLEDCIFRSSITTSLLSGVHGGSTFTGNLFITTSTGNPIIGCEGDAVFTKNTFVNLSSGGAPLLQCKGSDTFTNNILYAPNTICTMLITCTQAGTIASSSSKNIFLAPDETSLIYTNGVGFTEGVGNLRIDPLFLERTKYTLKRISPAIKSGVGGVNIGWDQITIGLPAAAPRGLVNSTPNISYPGDLMNDTDNGGGIDTTNTNDYSSGLYNLGNLRR